MFPSLARPLKYRWWKLSHRLWGGLGGMNDKAPQATRKLLLISSFSVFCRTGAKGIRVLHNCFRGDVELQSCLIYFMSLLFPFQGPWWSPWQLISVIRLCTVCDISFAVSYFTSAGNGWLFTKDSGMVTTRDFQPGGLMFKSRSLLLCCFLRQTLLKCLSPHWYTSYQWGPKNC